jgi:YfiH family protein
VSAQPSEAPATVELGDGFIYVRRPDGQAAVLAPHLQSAAVAGMMTPASVNARHASELRAWLSQWGLDASMPVAQVDQVHGTAMVEMGSATARAQTQADGMWSDSPEVILAVKAADCAPVWFADVASRRFALVHAGWRGVADGIIAEALGSLRAQGTDVADLTVAVGPHLQSCCFEIGPEVGNRFSQIEGAVLPATGMKATRQRSDSMVLDLSRAIRANLTLAGVRDEQIFTATACTRCHAELFHSYRRNGAGGPLMAAVAVRRG